MAVGKSAQMDLHVATSGIIFQPIWGRKLQKTWGFISKNKVHLQ